MANENISSQILGAIDTIVDKKINSAGYDRTVVAKVIKCSNPLTGAHIVEYEGTRCTAYSQNGIIYNINDNIKSVMIYEIYKFIRKDK